MRIAPEGYREIAWATLILAALAAAVGWFFPLAALPCAAVWLWVLSFFRDPVRSAEYHQNRLYSPADGTVTDITELPHVAELGGPGLRIGVFLSIFNVHINRSPCAATVERLEYHPGQFLDARHPQAGARNESNTLVLTPAAGLPGPIVVRQIAGKIARRIICHARAGDQMPAGHRFGLIKFGSRTELIVPAQAFESTVKVGDKVYGGLTVLVRCREKYG